MAKKKTAEPAAPAAAQLNYVLLASVLGATRVEPFFMYGPPAELAPLVTAGYVEVRDDIKDETGNIAARVPEHAVAQVDAVLAQAAAAAQPPAAPPAPAAPFAPPAFAPAQPPAAAAPVFTPQVAAVPAAGAAEPVASAFKVLVNVPMPAAKRFGKASVYPFDSLVLNGAFFVPASKDRPNPAKSMASTVNSANARYAVVVGKETDGSDKLDYKKKFALRNIADGGAAGFGDEYKGVKGAGVWRVK